DEATSSRETDSRINVPPDKGQTKVMRPHTKPINDLAPHPTTNVMVQASRYGPSGPELSTPKSSKIPVKGLTRTVHSEGPRRDETPAPGTEPVTPEESRSAPPRTRAPDDDAIRRLTPRPLAHPAPTSTQENPFTGEGSISRSLAARMEKANQEPDQEAQNEPYSDDDISMIEAAQAHSPAKRAPSRKRRATDSPSTKETRHAPRQATKPRTIAEGDDPNEDAEPAEVPEEMTFEAENIAAMLAPVEDLYPIVEEENPLTAIKLINGVPELPYFMIRPATNVDHPLATEENVLQSIRSAESCARIVEIARGLPVDGLTKPIVKAIASCIAAIEACPRCHGRRSDLWGPIGEDGKLRCSTRLTFSQHPSQTKCPGQLDVVKIWSLATQAPVETIPAGTK
ncbi:hypothetical protein HDU96_004947, partial [Phlyctochytrium bullatum]